MIYKINWHYPLVFDIFNNKILLYNSKQGQQM